MLTFAEEVRQLADGYRSSTEIAAILGTNARRVRKVLLKHDLPRLHCGAKFGTRNHAFEEGRRISLGGYAQVTAPHGHPRAKIARTKKTGWVWEHWLVMEQKLGRYLLPEEIVDHVDGLTLHNAPDNLRLFASNAEHLRVTLTGRDRYFSEAGRQNMFLRHRQPEALQRVDIHRQRKEAGAVRLRQILLAALRLGTDSPYLLGSSRHTRKAGIDMSSRSTIERALADLSERWGWPLPQ
jgi:hypothetical protein